MRPLVSRLSTLPIVRIPLHSSSSPLFLLTFPMDSHRVSALSSMMPPLRQQ